MAVWALIRGWWRARQRAIDITSLWPACLELTVNREDARALFGLHVLQDPAWLELGEEKLHDLLERL